MSQTLANLETLYRNAPFVETRSLRQVGIEDELLVVVRSDGTMGDALRIVGRLAQRSGWTPHFDESQPDLLIGAVHPDWGEVTLDAGRGTLEWISKPSPNLLALAEHRRQILNLLVSEAEERGACILGVGRQPVTRGSAATLAPKRRYKLFLRRFGDSFGALAESASEQVHVQCRNPDDMLLLTNDMLMLTGPLVALAANSPLYWSRVGPLVASRVLMWDEYAPGRVGIPQRPYETITDICIALCDAEYVFGPDGSGGHRLFGEPFRHAMSAMANVDGFRQHAAYHEGCFWWDVRPRFRFGTVEVRPCCQQPPWMRIAFAALILGLAENTIGRRSFLNLFDWSAWKSLRQTAAELHFLAPIGTARLGELLPDLVDVAEQGLALRGIGEEVLLQPLWELVEERQHPPAIDQIAAFRRGGVPELVREFAHTVSV